MQFVFDLIQKIPAGWPRWSILAAIVVGYFLVPNFGKKLRGREREKEALERLMRFLQLKKLLLDLEVLQKEKNLARFEFPGETRLLGELRESELAASEVLPQTESYVGRLKYSFFGGTVFFLAAAILVAVNRSQEAASTWEIIKLLLWDLGFSAACALLASFIPFGTRHASFFYGLTMPFAIVLLFLVVTR